LRLKKDKWLNDTCINTYFEILLAKSKGCLIANSGLILIPPHQKWRPYTVFFENNGRVPTSLLKKTAPIFVPINAGGVHWALLVIHPATKTLTYYDSLSWKPGHEVEKVKENLRKFAELEGITSDISDWKVVSGSCPQQSNGNDCGVFTCMAADRLMQGLPLDYSAKDVPYMRLKMLSEFIRAHGA
jgi:sentrin-specific protease 1